MSPNGQAERCLGIHLKHVKGSDTSGKGNGEGVPLGTNTQRIRKRFIAVKAIWLQSWLPEEVLLEGLQTIAWGCTSCTGTHFG